LISASTCAAAVPPWAAGAAERGAGEREDADADGPGPALRGGTVATAGGAAMAIPAGLPAQGPAAAAPHPAAVARVLTAVRPDAVLGKNTLRVK
jgi:hypothetical protein